MQRDARALLEDELATVDGAEAGEHPQKGGLAGAVAARERHAIAPLELERDPPKQGSAGHVLVQRRCDHDRHGPNRHTRHPHVTPDPAPWPCGPPCFRIPKPGGPTVAGCARGGAGRAPARGGFVRADARSGAHGPGIRRRVQARRLYPLHRGVYAVGHQALSWRAHLLAAVYACGPGALASHRAAGALHGLVRSGRIEVTAARGVKPKPGITVHRSARRRIGPLWRQCRSPASPARSSTSPMS